MRMQKTIGLSLALLIVSASAWAKQAHAAHHHPAPSAKSKHARLTTDAARSGAKRHRASAAHADRRHARHVARARPPDEYIGRYRVVGQREVGSAAWYGGRHIGHRTASGEPLDAVHLTAAHRVLPLHSLVRVTNLRNGRSVVATINDRGPVSRSLLIDVSPRVADELDMKQAGIVKVAIVPVARADSPMARADNTPR